MKAGQLDAEDASTVCGQFGLAVAERAVARRAAPPNVIASAARKTHIPSFAPSSPG